VPSVEGYKACRNFREIVKGEVRSIPLPRTRVHKGKRRKGRSVAASALLHHYPLGWLSGVVLGISLGRGEVGSPVGVQAATEAIGACPASHRVIARIAI
jgi:hypothetical protein